MSVSYVISRGPVNNLPSALDLHFCVVDDSLNKWPLTTTSQQQNIEVDLNAIVKY